MSVPPFISDEARRFDECVNLVLLAHKRLSEAVTDLLQTIHVDVDRDIVTAPLIHHMHLIQISISVSAFANVSLAPRLNDDQMAVIVRQLCTGEPISPEYIQAPKPVSPPPPPPPISAPIVRHQVTHIYLIEGQPEHFKIGKSKNVLSRLSSLGTGLPHKPRLIHSFPAKTPARAESVLHQKFKDKRLNGEWFRLTPEDVEWVKAINEM
jgi:hypothetical protein